MTFCLTHTQHMQVEQLGFILSFVIQALLQCRLRFVLQNIRAWLKKANMYCFIRNKADSRYMEAHCFSLYARNVFLALQSPIYKFQFSDSSGVAKALASTFGWAVTTACGRDTYHSFLLHDVQGLPGFIWGKLEEGKVRILIWRCWVFAVVYTLTLPTGQLKMYLITRLHLVLMVTGEVKVRKLSFWRLRIAVRQQWLCGRRWLLVLVVGVS